MATTDGVGSFLVNYGPTCIFNQNYVVLSSFMQTLAGDYNRDAVVHAADYVVWRNTGIGGQLGYENWRAHFGQTTSSGSVLNSIHSPVAVPEPASILSFIVALMVVGIRRSWRASM